MKAKEIPIEDYKEAMNHLAMLADTNDKSIAREINYIIKLLRAA